MNDTKKKTALLINLAYFAAMITIGLFAIRYALGVCFPFVFAFLVATALQKPKNFIVNKTFLKGGSASALCVLLLIIIIAAVMSLIGLRLIREFSSFWNYILLILQDIDSLINSFELSVLALVNSLPDFAIEPVQEMVESLFTQVRTYLSGESGDIVANVTGAFNSSFSLSWITAPLNGVISTASAIPSFLIAVVVTLVACCFMTSDYDIIVGFFTAQLSEKRNEDLIRAKQILKSSMAKIGKAYLLIIGITFAEMSIGLGVLTLLGFFSSGYLFVIAAITAVVDIIPVLGTGTIIVPWAIYELIVGETGMGIGLLVLYATITVIRQIMEPKLVAGQLGLSPIITIGAMYFGVKIIGFAGIFIAPILIIMLKLLNDEGIIHLWKSPSKVKAAALQKQAQEQEAKEIEEVPQNEEPIN